jgi:protoheme IX farnesyltransferase
MGHGGIGPKARYSLFERFWSFFEITRPFLLLMAAPLAGMGAVLALNGFPRPADLVVGIVIPTLATAGIHTFNDWRDRVRDLKAWPARPIPTGRISANEALAYALGLMLVSVAITWLYFNVVVTIVLAIAIVLGILYCTWLRDSIGYLSLPPIIAAFPIGGWAAFAPESLFQSKTPWLLALFTILWQGGHIMVHAPGHPHEDKDGVLRVEKKAFLFYPTPATAAWLGLVFIVLTLICSAYIWHANRLGWISGIMTFPMGMLMLATAILLVGKPTSEKRSMLAFNTASAFVMFAAGGPPVEVLIRSGVIQYVGIGLRWLDRGSAFLRANAWHVVSVATVLAVIVMVGVLLFALSALCIGMARALRSGE